MSQQNQMHPMMRTRPGAPSPIRILPAAIQAPATGGRFILRTEGAAALRHARWRSTVVSNTGLALQVIDDPVLERITVVVQPAAAAVPGNARIAIQKWQPVNGGYQWIDTGAEATIAQSAAAPPPATPFKPHLQLDTGDFAGLGGRSSLRESISSNRPVPGWQRF